MRALALAAGINVGATISDIFLFFSFLISLLTAVVKIPEGIVVGIQIFAWAPN